MTRIIRRTSQFKKDVKRQEKRGKDFKEFKGLVNKIAEGVPLEDFPRKFISILHKLPNHIKIRKLISGDGCFYLRTG